jgi:hypothetical protein
MVFKDHEILVFKYKLKAEILQLAYFSISLSHCKTSSRMASG